MDEHTANTGILYLNRREVIQLCEGIDSVAAIREVFRLHGSGQTRLPDEAYLGWENGLGESVRSLNMPGYVGGSLNLVGTKIINGNIANPKRGLPRASGLTVLYDAISAQPTCIMDSSYISSLRTASVTALATELVKGPDIHNIALIGAGVLAQAHIELLVKRLRLLKDIYVYDFDEQRAHGLLRSVEPILRARNVEYHIAPSAEHAIRLAQLIVPVTTTTVGYIPFQWLQPGAIVVNVSLDDVLPDVVFQADSVIVDDWHLVKSDTKRLLGRMYRKGQIIGPDEEIEGASADVRKVDAQIGELVTQAKVGRRTPDDIILVNPFGLAIEDVAIAGQVYQKALEQSLGIWLER